MLTRKLRLNVLSNRFNSLNCAHDNMDIYLSIVHEQLFVTVYLTFLIL
jgi:hypothetical protein